MSEQTNSSNPKSMSTIMIVVSTTLLAVAVILPFIFGGDDIIPPPSTITIFIVSSDTKARWMDEMVKQFNDEKHTLPSGEVIFIESVEHVLSGDSVDDIVDGILLPTVWSPGDPYWVGQLEEKLRAKGQALLITQELCPETVYSPLGIAMWKPMAERLGWPEGEIGWKEIIALAEEPAWPGDGTDHNWGKFRFGHAHPAYSNAGMQMMVSVAHSILELPQLTTDNIYSLELEDAVRTLEKNTSKYGTNSSHLLRAMALQGPRFLHAVATYESQMIAVNENLEYNLWHPLVFIFPKDGTFWSPHPYCILDNADWVSEKQAEAAEIFYEYLSRPEQQSKASNIALRPLDQTIPLGTLFSHDYTTPDITIDDVPPLPSPGTAVGEALIDLFLRTKRKATVAIVLDISGSMSENSKIGPAVNATIEFLNRLDPQDEVMIITFNDEVRTFSELVRVGDGGGEIANRLRNIIPSGGTAMNQALCTAAETLQVYKQEDVQANESRLYGIVLLSDGQDTEGNPSIAEMFADWDCFPSNDDGTELIKNFPIAFGDEADTNVLRQIADRTGGRFFEADPEEISKVYRAISAEQ